MASLACGIFEPSPTSAQALSIASCARASVVTRVVPSEGPAQRHGHGRGCAARREARRVTADAHCREDLPAPGAQAGPFLGRRRSERGRRAAFLHRRPQAALPVRPRVILTDATPLRCRACTATRRARRARRTTSSNASAARAASRSRPSRPCSTAIRARAHRPAARAGE